MHVEPVPRRSEAMAFSGRGAQANGGVGQVGPDLGGEVVDVQVAQEGACSEGARKATVGRMGNGA
jgi:hypothetical protein